MFCVCTFSEGAAGAGSRAPASGVSAPAVPAQCDSGRVSEGERSQRHVDNLVLDYNFKVDYFFKTTCKYVAGEAAVAQATLAKGNGAPAAGGLLLQSGVCDVWPAVE